MNSINPSHRLVLPAAILAFAVSCASPLFAGPPPLLAPAFEGLGFLPGETYSRASALSDSGLVVVGHSHYLGTYAEFSRPFRWSLATGMVELVTPPGAGTYVTDISANGVRTLGNVGSSPGNFVPTIWASSGSFVQPDIAATLPPGGPTVICTGISGDGGAIVGHADYDYGSGDYQRIAFRWTLADGAWDLGVPPNTLVGNTEAWAISSDGAVIVGDSGGKGFRWTQADGMIALGALPGGDFSQALDASSDGSVVVGQSQTGTDHTTACRWKTWSIGNGMLIQLVDLGLPIGEDYGRAFSVSADGTIIGGTVGGGYGEGAILWDADHGMRWLQPVLESEYNLAAELEGWELESICGVAADNTYLYLAGGGKNPDGQTEAWWARIPKPGPNYAGRFRLPLLFNHEPYLIICDPAGPPHGLITFSVLGARSVDVRGIVRSSIRFGNATSAAATWFEYGDVNRDGLMDLVLQFNLQDVFRGMDLANTHVLRFEGTSTADESVFGEVLVEFQVR